PAPEGSAHCTDADTWPAPSPHDVVSADHRNNPSASAATHDEPHDPPGADTEKYTRDTFMPAVGVNTNTALPDSVDPGAGDEITPGTRRSTVTSVDTAPDRP